MQPLIRFINHEATAGFILVVAAIAALIASNDPWLAPFYQEFLTVPAKVAVGDWELAKPLFFWINDALMTVFFFLVGLEIKRELQEGHLASRDQLMLPLLAAASGMAVPAAVYTLVAYQAEGGALLRGWAIPAATDIAFALGVLALLGPRVPLSLKVFLLALATLDDLGAIAIIAVFYTSGLSLPALGLAGLVLAVLMLLNRARGRQDLSLYRSRDPALAVRPAVGHSPDAQRRRAGLCHTGAGQKGCAADRAAGGDAFTPMSNG